LIADLSHICNASNVGAKINIESLPLSTMLRGTLEQDKAIELALSGGDDYELLFTVSEDNKVGMETALSNLGIETTCIGQINASNQITTVNKGKPLNLNIKGFEHFSTLSEVCE